MPIPIAIIYSDNHLLVVNKPAGRLTQATERQAESVEGDARQWIKETMNKPGNVYLHAVHRLDKPVSGIVLFARTSKALSRLQEQMRGQRLTKIYHAVIDGLMPGDAGGLTHYLEHGDQQAIVHNRPVQASKKAELTYRVLAQNDTQSLVEIELHTGRYHQIRAQMAAAGCPIVGDTKYGSRKRLPGECIALHHYRLAFDHPVQSSNVSFTAPYPSPWSKILQSLYQ